jgi:hypothetical protein
VPARYVAAARRRAALSPVATRTRPLSPASVERVAL